MKICLRTVGKLVLDLELATGAQQRSAGILVRGYSGVRAAAAPLTAAPLRAGFVFVALPGVGRSLTVLHGASRPSPAALAPRAGNVGQSCRNHLGSREPPHESSCRGHCRLRALATVAWWAPAATHCGKRPGDLGASLNLVRCDIVQRQGRLWQKREVAALVRNLCLEEANSVSKGGQC